VSAEVLILEICFFHPTHLICKSADKLATFRDWSGPLSENWYILVFKKNAVCMMLDLNSKLCNMQKNITTTAKWSDFNYENCSRQRRKLDVVTPHMIL